MDQKLESRLILGGHSFIAQLGNDPPATVSEQRGILEACLDGGITWIDTTYLPERIAAGDLLRDLGRRSEAKVLAWNFFTPFVPGDPVGGADYYLPAHIAEILAQLRSDYVDVLVVLPLEDAAENARQVELVRSWQRDGRVRSLGLWVEDVSALPAPGAENPFQLAIHPCNVATPEAPALFAACKDRGMQTFATSPFHRGWALDRLIEAAVARGEGKREELRPVLADLMLRYALHAAGVDRVIVAMRRAAWVARNLESVARGPLAPEELRRLQKLQAWAQRRAPLWRRLLRRL